MHHGQNRKKVKKQIKKKSKLNETKGEMYEFCENKGTFIIFWKLGEYAICIIGFWGWTPCEYVPLALESAVGALISASSGVCLG